MLTCITCKQKIDDDGGEEGPRGTAGAKDSVKSLTAQVLILHPTLGYHSSCIILHANLPRFLSA